MVLSALKPTADNSIQSSSITPLELGGNIVSISSRVTSLYGFGRVNFFCSSRCTREELHKSLYLVQSQGGRLRQICVPQAWQERVRQAVSDYRKMQEPIEEVSELSGNDLKKGIANRSLRRLIHYGEKIFCLSATLLAPLGDCRLEPRRSTPAVVKATLIMFWTRLPSLNALWPKSPPRALLDTPTRGSSTWNYFDKIPPRHRGLCWAAGSASEQCRCAWHDFQSGGSGISGRTESCDGDEELSGQVPRLFEFLLRPVTE